MLEIPFHMKRFTAMRAGERRRSRTIISNFSPLRTSCATPQDVVGDEAVIIGRQTVQKIFTATRERLLEIHIYCFRSY